MTFHLSAMVPELCTCLILLMNLPWYLAPVMGNEMAWERRLQVGTRTRAQPQGNGCPQMALDWGYWLTHCLAHWCSHLLPNSAHDLYKSWWIYRLPNVKCLDTSKMAPYNFTLPKFHNKSLPRSFEMTDNHGPMEYHPEKVLIPWGKKCCLQTGCSAINEYALPRQSNLN